MTNGKLSTQALRGALAGLVRQQSRKVGLGLACGLLVFVAACSRPGTPQQQFPFVPFPPQTAIAYLVALVNGDVDALAGDLATIRGTFEMGGDGGVVVDALGNLLQADSGAGDIRIACGIVDNRLLGGLAAMTRDGDAFDGASMDRTIGSGVGTPTGIALTSTLGFIIQAQDDTTDTIQVFSSSGGANATALASISLSTGVHGIAYDENSDTLYAAGDDGVIYAFDGFADGGDFPLSGPTRTITPDDGGPISTSLRGIGYDGNRDVLIVTDVGDVGTDGDGSVYFFNDASSADGDVTPDIVLTGPATTLSDPVALLIDGTGLVIVNQSTGGDTLLRYASIFSPEFAEAADLADGDVAPDASVASAHADSPFSITPRTGKGASTVDSSDTDTGSFAPAMLFYTEQSANHVIGLDLNDLTGMPLVDFDAAPSSGDVFGIVIDGLGNAYVTDNAGGIGVVHRLAFRDGDTFDDTAADRALDGGGTSVGIDVSSRYRLIFVADPGEGAVLVYSMCADGSAAEVWRTDISGGNPIDLDYDEFFDTLYVVTDDDHVIAIDDFVFDPQDDDSLARIITPVDGVGDPIASGLFGVEYVAVFDQLYLVDINNGALYIVNASDEDGNPIDGEVEVSTELFGFNAPTDVAVDIFSGSVYVADNGDGEIHRFDNLIYGPNNDKGLGLELGEDVDADETVTATDVVSLTLFVSDLPTP
jgi:hypothetical protein